MTQDRTDWPLFEVFIRPKHGLGHSHAGSVHAADARMALENARDLFTRRGEAASLWVVPSRMITASSPDDSDALFAPADDKIYRHPSFYPLPDDVEHL